MTEPFKPAAPEDHALHDPLWMAALASRDPDLSTSERTRAVAALESCGACADLLAELVAVSAAIPAAAIPARPRDYTLTAADAARLRPRGLRRWLSAIGSVRDGITFPLAMGLTTMGIAGLLVATLPTALSGMGGASSAAAPEILSAVGAPVPAPEAAASAPAAAAPASAAYGPAASAAASAAPGVGQSRDVYASATPPDSETTGDGGVFSGDDGDAASQAAQRQDAAEMAREATIRDDTSGRPALVVLATALLIAGLGLFALRWTNRRLGDS